MTSPATQREYRWSSATASVRGSSHERTGTVNQDAVLTVEAPGDVGMVVAVADGHGSRTHVRSDAGSRLAVDVACKLGVDLLVNGMLEQPSLDIDDRLRGPVSRTLFESWRARVRDDVAANPWTAAEIDVSPGVVADPYHGYGSTVMLAIAGAQRVAVLQLGDGDVLLVRRSGTASLPVPGDDRLIGNQTTSLCLDSAPDDFRSAVIEFDDDPAAFVSITTDGYANSFASENWAADVGPDMLKLINDEGLDYVAGQLPDWLGESARIGGDDVTMGLIRAQIVDAALPPPASIADTATLMAPARDLGGLEEHTTQVRAEAPSRKRLWTSLGALAVIALAAAAVYLFVIRGDGDTEPTDDVPVDQPVDDVDPAEADPGEVNPDDADFGGDGAPSGDDSDS